MCSSKTPRDVKGGLFPHPPRPSSFKTKEAKLLRDLLSIEPVILLNAAFCEHHRRKCFPTKELQAECEIVDEYQLELDEMLENVISVLPESCVDNNDQCMELAKSGECIKNSGQMSTECRESCHVR